MAKLEVQVFQVPSVKLDGQPVVFPFKRVDALFYYLVCQKRATRREMVDLLWAECAEELGYKNLRHTIYILRKCLGADIVVTLPKTELRLNPDREIVCDFDAHGARSARDIDQFLRGFTVKNAPGFNAWIDQTRERLNAEILESLSSGASAALERGDTTAAERLAMEYLNWDGLDEPMTAFLMGLYRRDGRYYKAAALYQRLKDKLAEELGITPLGETTALYYEIVNQWNETAAEDGERREAPPLSASRAALYQKLRAAYEGFLQSYGASPSLLLWGDAGCGKTYLLQYFLRFEDLSRTLVLTGTCSPAAGGDALAPWRSVMVTLAQEFLNGGLELPESLRDTVAPVFPVFSGGGEPKEGTLSGAAIAAVALLFSLAARKRKLLLVFEDLQWMPTASQDLLVQLLRRLGGSQLLLLGASRTRNLDLAFSLDEGLLQKWPVPCFTRQETNGFLDSAFHQEIAPAIRDRVYEVTGGNPKLLAELAERLRGKPLTEEALPDAGSILQAHLAGLSEDARRLASVLSLFWEKAPCRLLADLTGFSTARLYDLSEEMKESGLIEELWEDGESYLAFLHPHLRDILYQGQSYFARQPLHLRIAGYLEDRGPVQDAVSYLRLAYHCRQGGDVLRRVRYAVGYLDRFTRSRCQVPPLVDRTAAPWDGAPLDDRFQKQERAIRALRNQSVPEEELAGLEETLLCAKARWLIYAGKYQEGTVLLRELAKRPDSAGGPAFQLDVRRIQISYELHIDQPEVCRQAISQGMELAQKADLPRMQAEYLFLWGVCFAQSGDYYRADYFLSEAMERMDRLDPGNRMFQAVALGWKGECKRRAMDFDGAVRDGQAALEAMPHPGVFPGAGWLHTCCGRALLAMGNETEAAKFFTAALAAYAYTRELPGRALAQCYAARSAAAEGNYAEAADLLIASKESADLLSSLVEQGVRDSVLAQLRRDLDRSGERNNPVHRYLYRPLDIYSHRGMQRLRGIPGAYEYKTLEECLRFGLSDARPLSVKNLYSKKRNFTAE